MRKYKTFLSVVCQLALFLVWHHYYPIVADVEGILFIFVILALANSFYFAGIQSKERSIAKYNARHGIPLDQPHKIDEILKEGFFKKNNLVARISEISKDIPIHGGGISGSTQHWQGCLPATANDLNWRYGITNVV